MALEADGYAFPGTRYSREGMPIGVGQGMTMRDYFAGQVISHSYPANLSADELADQAYEIADAMMARRTR